MGKPCNKCGQQIGWRQEGERYIPLNIDGSDHKPTCSGKPTEAKTYSQPYTAKEMDLSNFKPEFVTPAEQQIWNDIVTKVTEYTLLAQKKIQEFPEITNPALKGLISNNAFQVLNQINERRIKK